MLIRELVVFMATLLALGTALQAWRTRSAGLACLAGWLATVVVTGLIIVALNSGLVLQMSRPVLQLLAVVNVCSGGLLLGYIAHAADGRRPPWWGFLPVIVFALYAWTLGRELRGSALVNASVAFEMACTLGAWLVWATGARAPWQRPVPAALAVLIAISTMHASQVAIMFHLVPAPWLYNINFVVIGAWFLAALVYAVVDSPALRALAPTMVPAADADDRDLFARIETCMREARPWSDPDLEVGDLASRVAASPNAVSRALNRAGTTSFYDYINGHRVREAERLLLDPAEARYKVEALGRQAGFKARSTFFKVFRNHTGLTPAEYRRRHSAISEPMTSPSAPARTGSSADRVAGRES